eukprot:3583298-Pleurochrysis_carterae.AAC.3
MLCTASSYVLLSRFVRSCSYLSCSAQLASFADARAYGVPANTALVCTSSELTCMLDGDYLNGQQLSTSHSFMPFRAVYAVGSPVWLALIYGLPNTGHGKPFAISPVIESRWWRASFAFARTTPTLATMRGGATKLVSLDNARWPKPEQRGVVLDIHICDTVRESADCLIKQKAGDLGAREKEHLRQYGSGVLPRVMIESFQHTLIAVVTRTGVSGRESSSADNEYEYNEKTDSNG